MTADDRNMLRYFRMTFWSIVAFCIGLIFSFLQPILIMDLAYGAYKTRAIEKKVERLSHESPEWRSAQYEIVRLRENSVDSETLIIVFTFILGLIVGPSVVGEMQLAMLRNPIYSRPEPEWRRLQALSGFLRSGGILVLFVLFYPVMVVFALIWYWKFTRACVAIATTCGATELLAHARRAKFNSAIILVDVILLPLIYWAAWDNRDAPYLVILVWLLVGFCVYSLFQLLILLHHVIKTFKGGSNEDERDV